MKKHKNTNGFVLFWIVLFTIGFLIISGRFLYIQITGNVQNVSLIDWAENVRKASATLESERGSILDTNGNLLAFNRPVYRMYAILDEEFTGNSSSPLHVTDIDETAAKLSEYIELDENEIKEILQKGIDSDAFQVEFGSKGKDLSEETKDEITELDLPGINFLKESKRYYPNNHFASHIIGFVNESEELKEVQGVTGIESMFNKQLIGEDGYINYERDRFNKKLFQRDSVVKEPEDGNDIYLTIDQKIQSLLEDTLDKVVDKYDPERLTTVVMNAKTGEILALANRPSVNPNDIAEVQNWYNDAISTPVEPGSTMKIFTWAAAIDAGVYDGSETFTSGKYKIHEQVEAVNDHNQGVGWGDISYDEGFYRSSNVAASKLVWEKMDENVYLDYLDKFGLFDKTNIELPNEMVGELSFNYPSDKIRTAFGQSSTVTPIEQMKAATVFANKGEMVQPMVVKKEINPKTGETVRESERTVVGQPISEETAEKMLDLMDGVVNNDKGTGNKYQLDNYTAIGKTGTAQMPNLDGGGYQDGGLMYSFLGMAPKDDPQLIVYTSALNPELKDTETGADAVSEIFNNIMENSLHYLNIEPDNDESEEAIKVKMPEVTGQSKKEAEKALADFKDVVFIGNGDQITASSVSEDTSIYDTQKILLLTDKPVMPNINGWSSRDVHRLASLLDIPLETKGEGFVTKQSIKKGKAIKKDMTLKVDLATGTKKKDKKK